MRFTIIADIWHVRSLCLRSLTVLAMAAALSACASGSPAPTDYVFQPRPGQGQLGGVERRQGQYVRPDWMEAQPTPRLPAVDLCRSQTYAALVGVNEGAIWIPGLPGRKRIIRPAVFEGPDNDFLNGEMMEDTYVEVRNYLPGQQLYAPAIGEIGDRIALRDDDLSRLTIELDREGFVQEIRCG